MLSNVKVFFTVPNSTLPVQNRSNAEYDFSIEHTTFQELQAELATRVSNIVRIWAIPERFDINDPASYARLRPYHKICVLHRAVSAVVGAEFHEMSSMYDIVRNLHIRLCNLEAGQRR